MKIKIKITAIDKENSLQKQKGELYLGLKKKTNKPRENAESYY